MVYTIDLHTHTYYSDGRAAPEELLTYAAQIGIKTLAITDHDNMHGTREGAPLARRLGIELIPAVEFTARWDELPSPPDFRNIDVLGYFVDTFNPSLGAFETAALEDIHAGIAVCCQRMTDAGYPIRIEDVFVLNPRYAGALYLIDTVVAKGYADGWNTSAALVDRFINQVPLTSHTIAQVIAAIRSAGGTAVLAHPVLVRNHNAWLDEKWMGYLVDMGLEGIEIYHLRLDETARRYFLRLAKRFNLAVTGGSDDHGWPTGFPRLGGQPVTQEMVERLRRGKEGDRQ